MKALRPSLVGLLTFFALFYPVLRAQELLKCSPSEAAAHVGAMGVVTGRVDSFHQSSKGNVFLNMGGAYPHQAFTAFVPAAHAANVPNAKDYQGKVVTVTGKIQLYRGKPEIIVTSEGQLKRSP